MTMLDSLLAVADDGAVTFGNGYIDFSIECGDGRTLEVSDGEDTVQLDLSRAELLQLHAALTRMLVADLCRVRNR